MEENFTRDEDDGNDIMSDDQSVGLVEENGQVGELARQEAVPGLKMGTRVKMEGVEPIIHAIEESEQDGIGRPLEEDADSSHSHHGADSNSRPSTARETDSSTPSRGASSAARAQRTLESTVTAGDRASRRRSAIESRSSNRLSGFFSNLMHRRDEISNQSSRSGLREESTSSPVPGDTPSAPMSRAPSPTPARPITPPPALPSPTLKELGLSLSVLTSNLSPSHFSTPPSSGAFLAPHYLLLCHAQGLDVLPLASPPAPQPYALIRRASFKSVIVMEQRGVLVAIAGRRDGVRVYALEEVRKEVEWRIEVEVRRERERSRREEAKRAASRPSSATASDLRLLPEKAKLSLMPPISTSIPLLGVPPSPTRTKLNRKTSQPGSVTSNQMTPRTPTTRKVKSSLQTTPTSTSAVIAPSQEPNGRPPPYSSPPEPTRPQLRTSNSVVSLSRPRRPSVSNVLAAASTSSRRKSDARGGVDSKPDDDWMESRGSSDDEAIDVVAAGASGSQALDERTSAIQSSPTPRDNEATPITLAHAGRAHSHNPRRNRPANLDLTLARTNTSPIISPPSPVPTLLGLRQSLRHPPITVSGNTNTPITGATGADTPEPDIEDDDDEGTTRDTVSLAQMLFESRIPDLPPAGTRHPQQPIIISTTNVIQRNSESQDPPSRSSTLGRAETRRRRRWSVLDSFRSTDSSAPQPIADIVPSNNTPSAPTTPIRDPRSRRDSHISRSHSSRPSSSATYLPSHSTTLPHRPSSASIGNFSDADAEIPPVPTPLAISAANTPTHSRFIPRIISNAFSSRRSEDQPQTLIVRSSETTEGGKKTAANAASGNVPPPKLECIKLPGTKGALMVKAVETAKKSFLAILCGENGEKVELFAGTYRTALGLSRTFILPDSPRSLELQLQGDDLVEVFLVFSQNVFGLEPATVRVREVRIGRAERRAARRRAREIRGGMADVFDTDHPAQDDEDTNVSLNIGVSVAAGADPVQSTGDSAIPVSAPPATIEQPHTPGETPDGVAAHAEELVALATAQIGPYTTFQQLSFAPNFPLAAIADDYIIPPTYPDFLSYRAEHEPVINGASNIDLAHVQFSPPGLPVPTPSPPSKWLYRDPKGVVHGPWKASLMQAWYKDGLLPPDLPVRKEEETDYVLLKDLRLQSVDPTHPFCNVTPIAVTDPLDPSDGKPLLLPISLLSQPKHYGPPALFFSSRGGHSTTIVDGRGRSVLKGRFVWSADDNDEDRSTVGRMGDIKRLEAFDVENRSIIVAMRHGGLEAMDLGDALLKPGDASRTVLPQFAPPPSCINRRGPFIWRMGTPINSSTTSVALLADNYMQGNMLPVKKHSNGGLAKSTAKGEFPAGNDDNDNSDEIMFLGRKEDDIYICERNAGTFRILQLSKA